MASRVSGSIITHLNFVNDRKSSLMTGWCSPFLFYLSRCTENELRRQNQILNEQLVMARELIPKQRNFLKREQKERLLKLGAELGPSAHKSIVIVHSSPDISSVSSRGGLSTFMARHVSFALRRRVFTR